MLDASSDVNFWILEVPQYCWPHIGCQFWCHGFLICAQGPWNSFIYFLQLTGMGVQGDTNGLLTLTNNRKEKVQTKDSVERKFCNDKKTISLNSQIGIRLEIKCSSSFPIITNHL